METRTAEPRTYWLARHVHVCRSGTSVVLLDLRQDQYIGVTGEVMDGLGGTIAGWPAGAPANAATASRCADLLAKMRTSGMLAPDAQTGKPAEPISMPRAESPLIEGYRKKPVKITPRDVSRFVGACASARLQMRCFSLERLVSRARARHPTGTAPHLQPDLARVRDCVQVFRRLRPLLYTGHDACLLDSFTLRLFLARHGFGPRWVFGVRTGPFTAHCWLQDGTVVINDTPEQVRRFTPIMVV